MQVPHCLKLHRQHLPFISLSMFLNHIHFLQRLAIENTGSEDTGAADLTITSDNDCIHPFTYALPYLPAGKEINIPLEQLSPNRQYIAALPETEKAIISIELRVAGTVCITERIYFDVHPIDFFSGFDILPELIGAYITPNHPYVYHIKRQAIEALEARGHRTAFDGYQRNDPDRVLQMMSAIYSAIRQEQIVYSAMAPGYETTGQKLRLLNTIQRERFANCIDLSLLFAACLEAINLHPVLIIVQGHAFIGCWLYDDTFTEMVSDDKTAITKRFSKGISELAVVEATSVCKGTALPFTDARYAAEARLVEKDDFILAVDIQQSRNAHIRPLPFLPDADAVQLDETLLQNDAFRFSEPDLSLGPRYDGDWTQPVQSLTRQKIWERKLLDLSLRNNLLNLRLTRNMLQLTEVDLGQLEDKLSEGKSFSILADNRAPLLRKYNAFLPALHHSAERYQTAATEMQYHRLLTNYHAQDLDNVLNHIYKNARQSIEENGSSTLFLALGLLKWFDSKTPDQPRYAPLLLIPVELTRKSVNSPYALKSAEEEPLINITLLEFLRQAFELDLAAMETLPYDEKGVDLVRLLAGFRRAIMQMKGWDITEQLVLGNFSFNKLILWKDLTENAQALQHSAMVKSLMDGRLYSAAEATETPTPSYDDMPAHSFTLPIATDVSQLDAIVTARQGHTFILHGPPGTGKSQTITNIIADALYNNKRVLFVAAKKAALEVVHKRMEQIGLAPFSLELHSNKSRKSDVLAQLARSLETARVTTTTPFKDAADRLDQAKKPLQAYINILHAPYANGGSLYQSIVALQDFPPNLFPFTAISADVLQQLHPRLWQQWQDWLPLFQAAAGNIQHPKNNPLSALQITRYSVSLQEELEQHIDQLLHLLPVYQQNIQQLSKAVAFPVTIQLPQQYEQFITLAQHFHALPPTRLRLIRFLADEENYQHYTAWSTHFETHQALLKEVLAGYHRDILQADLGSLVRQWQSARQQWFLPKWFTKRKIKKQLSLYRNSPLQQDEAVEALLHWHQRWTELQRVLQQPQFSTVLNALDNLYRGEFTELTALNLTVNLIRRLAATNPYLLKKWMLSLEQKQYNDSGEVKQADPVVWQQTLQQAAQTQKALDAFQQQTAYAWPQGEDWLAAGMAQLQQIKAQLPRLKSWINYRQQREQGLQLQLQWLLQAWEQEQCTVANLPDFFTYTIHNNLARQTIARHEALHLFDKQLFETKIAQYKKIAGDFRALTMLELRARLSQRLPNTTQEILERSEIGILQRAIRNKGRGTSIRRLFEQVPTVLPHLAPCMLMSPISVAQYFPMQHDLFDLVIFDEASQLPTCEAVSALARARQAIVVGDPKQMPPTSFFATNRAGEEEPELEDLESILDDCLSLSVLSKHLLRHYRSKHESLIAFSNAHYYDNQLLTFPSADDLNKKLIYRHVPGYYDKGHSRINAFEADAIVAFLQQHYTDPQKKNSSVGVVSFSQAQQNLIEDKLRVLFTRHPLIEQAATETAEPLFVKNLENVQGDERDIILFSIGYAPDESGKMTMNFGPLNREGGWRRLNVAVTRARSEMQVFATLRSDEIDLSRSPAAGVAGLKAFLQYAEKGRLALQPGDLRREPNGEQLSTVISRRLAARGLTVKTNIGASGFKIDIGILHPGHPGQYILGIILDGRYYYEAATSNDRELIIPAVLQSLGWQMERVWTMDWYEDAEKVLDTLVAKVNQLLAHAPAPTVPASGIGQQPTDFHHLAATGLIETAIPVSKKQRPYIRHQLSAVEAAGSEAIYLAQHHQLLQQQMQRLVDVEEPLSKNLLYKKLLQAWNISRISQKLDQHLNEVLNTLPLRQTRHQQPFFWSAASNPDTLSFYRDNAVAERSIEDIAPEEIIVALQETVQQQYSIDEAELLRYLARCFGFSKLGRQVELGLRYALDLAIQKALVKKEGDRVMMP